MTSANLAIWRPQTTREVTEARHVAGLYQAGVLEVWDQEQLNALLAKLQAELVILEQDTHAVPLSMFKHPDRVLYLMGPKNGSVPRSLRASGRIVQVETDSRFPLLPAHAAAIVLHDRYVHVAREAVA